jgi:hypothetical protein
VQKGKESAQCTTTTTTCDQAQKVEKVEKTVVHTGQIAEGSSSSSSSSSGEQEVNYGCACADLYDNCSQGSPDWTQQSLYTSPGQWGQLSNMKGFCKIDKCHDNFQTVGLHFGHSRSHGSKGAKIWNDTTFNNFSFQQVHAHSIDAHRANWSNFVFSDSNLNDWEWNDALLQTGYFSGNITDCKFTKATLKNVTFHNTNFKATKTIGKAGSTTFRHARFENVKFINGRLGRTSFANTIFMGNTYFENVSRFSFSRFENAIFVDADGRGHVLTPQIARRLDAAHQTQFTKGVRGRTISVSTNEIIQQIRQMSSL